MRNWTKCPRCGQANQPFAIFDRVMHFTCTVCGLWYDYLAAPGEDVPETYC
jgi:uncharacterized protein (DUF983 family)